MTLCLKVVWSTVGSGDPLTYTVTPPADSSGDYNLPVGTYPISVTVSNCAGSATCSTLVTVTDKEALDATKVSCGQLPATGVIDIPKGTTTNLPVYVPSYTKANGCPAEVQASNLYCQNCLLGSDNQADGSLDKCDSSISSAGVVVGANQVGRVKWTVTATDAAGHSAVQDCAICAEQVVGSGPLQGLGSGKCPSPFNSATTCEAGNY